jgi:AraC-like DNA-binding protein
MLVTGGSGHHLIDFRRHRCRRGTVLHVRPNQVQQFVRDSEFDAIAVLFTPVQVLRDPSLSAVSGTDSLVDLILPANVLAVEGDSLRLVEKDFERLAEEYERPGDFFGFREQILRHSLRVLMLRLVSMSARDSRADIACDATSHNVARFERLLEEELGRDVRVEKLAFRLGCSPQTLYRNCLAVRGIGPKVLIQQRLILEAQRLLVHTAWSAERIGAELGFDEPANFSRLFKRVVGMSPGQFRATHAKQLKVPGQSSTTRQPAANRT